MLQPVTAQHWTQFALCLTALLLNVWLLAAPSFGWLARIDRIALDQFFKQRPPIAVSRDIVYVEIAEDSFRKIGRWPWPRRYHAVLTHILHTWGAKAIVFDVLFSEPSAPSDDEALAEALRESGHVYLPIVLETHGATPAWIHPLPELSQHARAMGHINAVVDRDGVLRGVQPYLQAGNERYPHMALEVAYDLQGQKVPPLEKHAFPVDEEGRMLVNWAGRWTRTFPHYSYSDILGSFEAILHGRPPLVSPEAIRGKICLIGLTAIGYTDVRAVPGEPVYPALGIHANIINSVLTSQFVTPASRNLNIVCLLGIGLAASLLFLLFRPAIASIASFLLGIGWFAVAFLVFCQKSVWLSVAHPMLGIASVFIVSAVYVQVTGEREQRLLSQLATRDDLTGLFVIRHFRTLMNQAVEEARVRGNTLSVLMIDLDHFKEVNDTYGHAAGDKVLRQTTAIIQSCLRESDCAGRYGGEEIIVMLPRTPLPAAVQVAERIRTAVEQARFEWERQLIPVTVSAGAGTFWLKETVPDLMVRRADEALYRAKRGGRNRVVSESDPG